MIALDTIQNQFAAKLRDDMKNKMPSWREVGYSLGLTKEEIESRIIGVLIACGCCNSFGVGTNEEQWLEYCKDIYEMVNDASL